MIAAERETTINLTDADEYVYIYTCRRVDINALNKKLDKGVERTASGSYKDGTPWANFRIPKQLTSISKIVKTTRNLTPEQRASLSERMKTVANRGREQSL